MRDALLLGRGAASHDNLYWLLPIYHYFAGSLLNGSLPLWNPFSHGGEPFYPMLLHLRLLDPAAFVTLAVGQFFTRDLVTLANWHLLVLALITSFGSYLLLRQWCEYLVLRLSLIPILLWSSFLLVAFQQNGMVFQSLTVPFALYFLFRILGGGERRWGNWIGLALAVGFSLQSYFFVAVLTAAFLFLAGALLMHRTAALKVLASVAVWLRIAAFSAVVLVMLAPNLVMLSQQGDYSVSAREVDFDYSGRLPLQSPPQIEPGPVSRADDPLIMPFSLIRYTGSFGSPWDIALSLAPEGNRVVGKQPHQRSFGYPSEALFYVGMLVFVIALYGLFAGRHIYKRLWAFLGAGFGLLFLGPAGGLFWLLYQFFPPTWFNRHTHHYVDLVALSLLYFFVLGGNALLNGTGLRGAAFDGLLGRLFAGQDLIQALKRGVFAPLRSTSGARQSAPQKPPQNAPSGLAGRADLIAFLFYLPASVTFGYFILAASVAPTAVDTLPGELPWLAAWLLLTLLLARDLGRAGLFFALLSVQVILLLGLARERLDLAFDIGLLLVLPIMLAAFLRHRLKVSGDAIAWLLLVFLCADLFLYLLHADRLWTAPRPDLDPLVAANPAPPRWPDTRTAAVIPSQRARPPGGQLPRYVEVMARRAAAFTPVMLDAQEDAAYFASAPLPGWAHLALHPKAQGDGFTVKPAEPGEAVGNLLVTPRSDGPSVAEIPLSNLPAPKAHRLWLAVWVKNDSSVRNSVELALVTARRTERRTLQSIGGWARVVFEVTGLSDAVLRLAVAPTADATVRLSQLEISSGAIGAPPSEDLGFFTRVFEGRRWNSSIVPRRFQALVHSDLDAALRRRLLSIGRPLIEFRSADAAILSDDPLGVLAHGTRAEALALLERAVFLERRAAPFVTRLKARSAGAQAAAFKAEAVEYAPNRLVLDVTAPRPGFLYVADAHHSGWRARVDGREEPVFLANGLFKAVPLAAGRQKVVLSFRPTAFIVALGLFWATPLVALLALLLGRLRTRANPVEARA